MSRDVCIAGVGMTAFGKMSGRTLKSMSGQAVTGALRDAGLTTADLQGAFVGNAIAGLISGQEMVRGPVVLRAAGVQGIPIFSIENACASAASALHLAYQGIRSGTYDVVLALGVEQMVHSDKQRAFDAIGTALDLDDQAALSAEWGTDGQDRSPFMDLYAHLTRTYMANSGSTAEDFARVVVKARRNASINPLAQYRQSMTLGDVLAARTVVSPLTLPMCAPIGDGAAAAVLIASGHPAAQHDRATVTILASVMRSGTAPGTGAPSADLAAREAFESAGLGPEDVDVAEVHDATAPAELMAYEHLGFAPPGKGPRLLADGETGLSGRLPVNTSGGLLSRGHPIGATGLAQICELVWQLRGEAGDRQINGARVALAHNGGGWLNGDSAAMAVHLLGTTS